MTISQLTEFRGFNPKLYLPNNVSRYVLHQAVATTDNKENAVLNLTGPTDWALDREVRDSLTLARVGLLMRASFFGNMATRLKLINSDEWCNTAATDGRNFYYNSRFIKMLTPKGIEFLFGHEVLHVVFDHMDRREDRHPLLWNIADDYCVNSMCIKYKIGEKITEVPILHDTKYDGLSAEEIYDILYEKAEKIDVSALADKMLDRHLSSNNSDDNGDGPPKLTDQEKAELRDEIKEAILSAAKNADAGTVPAEIEKLISNLTDPKMPWTTLIQQQIISTVKYDFNWSRINRKGWDMDGIMPGIKNDIMIDVAIAFDASGSMSEEAKHELLSEVQGVMHSFGAFKIHLFSFDTHVFSVADYTSENLDTLTEYKVGGGGGTDFGCIFKHLKDNEIEPKLLIVFTDGYPYGTWGDENYCDTLWILHGTETIEPPFGNWAYYKK